MKANEEYGEKRKCDTECDDELELESDSNEAKQCAGPRNGDAKKKKANKRKYAGSYMYNVRFDVKWVGRNDCKGELIRLES